MSRFRREEQIEGVSGLDEDRLVRTIIVGDDFANLEGIESNVEYFGVAQTPRSRKKRKRLPRGAGRKEREI